MGGVFSPPRGSLILPLLLLAAGCGGGGGRPAVGEERGACYPNETCNDGLTCLSSFCVRVDVDGATDAGGDAAGDAPAGDAPGDAGADRADAAAPEVASTAAPHPRLPQIANGGGPVLETPRVQPLYYASDTEAKDLDLFLQELTRTSYWSETTSEYGVGPLTVAPSITITSTPTPTMTDDALAARLAANISGALPPWGAADPNTIYMYVVPPGTTVMFSNGANCCSDYGGYHFETTTANGITVPYAVICSCPAAFGLALSPLDARTTTISHELVEAATDPYPLTNPAYWTPDHPSAAWYYITGGETTDMCAVSPDANVVPPGSTYMVQRSWSNAAARASRNPCVPAPKDPPYFNAYPTLGTIDLGAAGDPYLTQGVKVPVGTSKTIDVVLSSEGSPSFLWDVGAYSYEDLRGGDPTNLALSLDRTRGKNGDVLHLTISPKRANPDLGMNAFVLISRSGSGAKLQSNVSMGLIVVK